MSEFRPGGRCECGGSHSERVEPTSAWARDSGVFGGTAAVADDVLQEITTAMATS